MDLTQGEFEDLCWGDHPDFETVDEDVDNGGRWRDYVTVYVKHKPTGDHYSVQFQRGKTENCDHDYSDRAIVKVEPYEETITVRRWRLA